MTNPQTQKAQTPKVRAPRGREIGTAGSWQQELDVALDAVRRGTALARQIRQDARETWFLKADRSPVTLADFAVQAVIADRLANAFPDDPLVAEEDGALLRSPERRATLEAVRDAMHRAVPALTAGHVLDAIDRGRGMPCARFWTLDPIDGTQGFVRGHHYVVALALIVHGRVQIGVIGCPQRLLPDASPEAGADGGAIVWAVRGGGAFGELLGDQREWVPMRVSTCQEPRRARVLRSFEPEHIDVRTFEEIIRALEVETAPMLMDSQAKHAAIASGHADLLIRIPATRAFRDKIWDQAAGTLLVEEAGGRVTDLRGADLDFGAGRVLGRNEGVIASNGSLHSAVLDAVRRVIAT